MKIILAGYSKTGTKSMADAFNILGYKTYDLLEHLYYHRDEWNKIYSEGGTADDFRRMYEGVDAVTDTPVFYFWEQLHEAFPDAKIILTVRDEDSWFASMVNQWKKLNRDFMLWFLMTCTISGLKTRRTRYNAMKFMGDVASWPSAAVHSHSELVLKRMYREHNAYVQTKAPKNQLLVYRVSEGWEPLCKFLGVDEPDQPFPHKNKDGAAMTELAESNKTMQSFQSEVLASFGVISVFVGWCGYKLFQNWPLLKGILMNSFEMVKNSFWF